MNLTNHINLLPYNTFHFNCIAQHFCNIASIVDWQSLVKTEEFKSLSHIIIGGGSNMLFCHDEYKGIAIKNEIKGRTIIFEDETSVVIEFGAGEIWDDIVQWTVAQGRCGLENLISIPGTVGATPIQNIGAYGTEVKDCITEVIYADLAGKLHTLSNKSCNFGYRDSIFKHELKGNCCITQVRFKLQKYTPETYKPNIAYGAISGLLTHQGKDLNILTPHDVSSAIAEIRASKMPDRSKIGTAGSFFKNPIIPESQYLSLKEQFPELTGHTSPTLVKDGTQKISGQEWAGGRFVKLSAGQLIDLSGLKGLDRGSVGTYHHHALILIHSGGGKGQDIVKLSKHIQDTVYANFQVHIEPEVNFI